MASNVDRIKFQIHVRTLSHSLHELLLVTTDIEPGQPVYIGDNVKTKNTDKSLNMKKIETKLSLLLRDRCKMGGFVVSCS